MKRKLKFTDYKNCLEAGSIENKINHLEKTKIDSLKFLLMKLIRLKIKECNQLIR